MTKIDPAGTADIRDDDRRSVGAVARVLRRRRQGIGRSATDSSGATTNYDGRGQVASQL